MKRGKFNFFSNMSLTQKREMKGLIFVAPFILGMILFFITPIFQSLMFSFGDISVAIGSDKGYIFEFKGIENYKTAFLGDLPFLEILIESLKSTIHIPFVVIVSFLIALLLKDVFPGRGIYRVIFFLPVIISSGILPNIDANDILQGLMGSGNVVTSDSKNDLANLIDVTFLSEILSSLNIGTSLIEYIMSAVKNIITIINSSGIQILIFLAALQTVSPSIYESAKVEGATGWETFWKITLPMISPQVLVVAIYSIIDSFVNLNNDMIMYLQNLSLSQLRFGYACATSWIYLLLVAVIVCVFYFVISRFVFYDDKER